jgi:hypothetical protein
MGDTSLCIMELGTARTAAALGDVDGHARTVESAARDVSADRSAALQAKARWHTGSVGSLAIGTAEKAAGVATCQMGAGGGGQARRANL